MSSIELLAFRGINLINTIDVVYVIATIIAITFALSLGWLFCSHTYIIMYNLSTIELAGLDKKNPFNKGNIRSNIE